MPKKKRNRSARPNPTGRGGGDQYVPLGYSMLHSDAWRSLSGPAVKVFLELRSRFNGGNNGKLCLSLDKASQLLRIGKTTAERAFAELAEKGFTVMTERGQWYGRKATTWQSTDRPFDGRPPSNDWKQWRHPPSESASKTGSRS